MCGRTDEDVSEVGGGTEIESIEIVISESTCRYGKCFFDGKNKKNSTSCEQYFARLKGQADGGNIADYQEKVNAIDGVGGVKVLENLKRPTNIGRE